MTSKYYGRIRWCTGAMTRLRRGEVVMVQKSNFKNDTRLLKYLNSLARKGLLDSTDFPSHKEFRMTEEQKSRF